MSNALPFGQDFEKTLNELAAEIEKQTRRMSANYVICNPSVWEIINNEPITLSNYLENYDSKFM